MAVLTDLNKLIPQYYQNKQAYNKYEKLCDLENAEIKAIMADFVLQHYETGEYKVTRTVTEIENVNEEMLLEIINRHPEAAQLCIKTKQYVDFDALENAIYNGNISQELLLEMDKARTTKPRITLRVSKIKKKKGEEDG